jgi:hypothetical protein
VRTQQTLVSARQRRRRYSVYLLYWHKSTNADTREALAHAQQQLAHAQQQLALQAQQLQALQLACMQREREVEEAEAASERQRSTLLLHVQAGTRVLLTYSRTFLKTSCTSTLRPLLLHVQAGTRVLLTYSRTLRPHALVP